MNIHDFIRKLVHLILMMAASLPASLTAQTGPVTLYATGFEAVEGYDVNYTLAGQNFWVVEGSGGNGLVSNFIPGQGQQAYLGFYPPTNQESFVILKRPLNYVPPSSHPTVVRFSVDLSIIDSTNGAYDDFRWSVYNLNSNRLFSLSLDNTNFAISYGLDDGAGFIFTGQYFSNSIVYSLSMDLDLASGRWSASLNQVALVNNQPISTAGSALNLGDIDAVWAIANPKKPGDNYMIFDNYMITAEYPPAPPLYLNPFFYLPKGQFFLSVTGEPSRSVVIEASTNLRQWTPVTTNSTASSGVLDYLDTNAAKFDRRFYRARVFP